MLDYIRRSAKGVVAWILLGLISIPFVFFGVNNYFTADPEAAVADVNGIDITPQQFTQAYRNQYQRIQSFYGENFRPELIDESRLKQETLNQMVRENVLRERVLAQGYAISDQQLRDVLYGLDIFQVDGAFSRDRYEDSVRRQGYTPTGFEARYREALKTDQLREGLLQSGLVTSLDVSRSIQLQKQTRNIQYARLVMADLREDVQLDESAIEAYYQDNQAAFTRPERVKLNFLELSLKEVAASIEVDEAEIQARYQANQSAYTQGEQRLARHILIETDKPDAQQQAIDLRGRILAGESLADLAKEYSDDLGSKSSGGDLGWLKQGDTVAPFEAALFALNVGEVSEVVESEFGFHIILLEDLQPASIAAYDSVRDELAYEYRMDQAETRYEDLQEQFEIYSLDFVDALEPIAESLGLSIQQTDWLTRTEGSGLAGFEAVREAAFSPFVLEDGENSQVIRLDDGARMVIIRVQEHEAEVVRPLGEVATQIQQKLINEQLRELVANRGEAQLTALMQSQDWALIREEPNWRVETEQEIQRTDTSLSAELLETVFSLARPAAGTSRFHGQQLANGDYVLLSLNAVKDGAVEEISEEERQRMSGQLLAEWGNRDFQIYVEGLRDRADVKLYPSRLE